MKRITIWSAVVVALVLMTVVVLGRTCEEGMAGTDTAGATLGR